MSTLTDSVAAAAAHGLFRGGVLAACSGGADSVALAHALARQGGVRAALGHVDHGLRPESAREAEAVRALARTLGVPFFVERLEGLRVRGPGLEAAAREARYRALARLARQAGAQAVATAHTRRDQAETLLLRLVRGAGPGALAGVRRRRPLAPGIDLVRPLLDVPRTETEAYCREHGLGWVDDPHNSDPARARARLRALWPALLELNPRLEEALAGAAEALAAEDELLTTLSESVDLASGHPALVRRALLRKAVEAGLHPERQHLEQLRALLARGRGSLDVPGGRVTVQDGTVRFTAGPPGAGSPEPALPALLAVPGPGSYAWRSRELVVTAGKGEGLPVDIASAPFPWTLRGHRPGDRFRPAGGRTRKVSDLWIDARIPRESRSSLALLEDAQGRLFWVEGVRESDACRGAPSHMATFRIRPEMKGVGGTLTSGRRPESGSATMDRRPDEEPR